MEWTGNVVLRFLDIYREEECLWKIKSKLYSNKFPEERDYDKLVTLCQQFERMQTRTQPLENKQLSKCFSQNSISMKNPSCLGQAQTEFTNQNFGILTSCCL